MQSNSIECWQGRTGIKRTLRHKKIQKAPFLHFVWDDIATPECWGFFDFTSIKIFFYVTYLNSDT
jgi:hypothetical protein